MNQFAGFIVAIIFVVSLWMLFKKAGDKGWKAIIPFYDGYTAYKLFWKKSMFWVTLALVLAAGAVSVGVTAKHVGDMNNILSAVANETGMSEEDILNENFNMTDEELQQAAQDFSAKVEADIENGEDTPTVAAIDALFANVSAAEIFLLLLAGIFMIAATVLSIVFYHKLSKAFGHGIGFTLGLIFLNPIFMLILAFGGSQYVGNNA